MAFWGGKEARDDCQARKDIELLEKYGLTSIDRRDINSVRKIINDLMGSGLMKTGMALSFAKAKEQVKVACLSAIVEQNWIIIRQLDRLNKHFEDLE